MLNVDELLNPITEPVSKEAISTLYSMGYELYRNGKYAEAKDVFRFLTLADCQDRRHWIGLGACHQMRKDYNDAVECYSVAAIQDPLDPFVHFYAAECIRHTGNKQLALKTLETSLNVAKETGDLDTFIDQLQHLHETWSQDTSGGSHG